MHSAIFLVTSRRSLAGTLAIYGALVVIVLAPIVGVEVPGLGDTLNHLARVHVLASIAGSPALELHYNVHWTPIPYLAMDLVVPLLTLFLPVYAAGKVFVGACVLMPVLGAVAIHGAIYRRLSLIPAGAFLFSYNYLLSLGFLNYVFTTGLALMLFAGWIATADWPRWPRAALFAAPVLILYFGHAFGCGAYCLAVAGFEIANALQRRPPFAVWVAGMLAAFSQAVPALAFAATLNVSTGYVGALQTHYGTFGDKVVALISPILFLLDTVNAVVIAVGVLCAIPLLIVLPIARAALAPALVVALAAIAMPHVLASTWGTDLRLPMVAALLVLSGLSWPASQRWRTAALTTLILLVSLKSADAWLRLREVDQRIADTRNVLASLPRGARLLVVNAAGHGTGREIIPASTIWSIPMVAIIDRDAFVPYLFSGLTTVRVQPPFLGASTPNGFPITPAQLRDSRDQPEATQAGDGEGARIYWRDWPHKFDDVLVQHGPTPDALPDNLTRIASGKWADLYRVNPAPGG